MNMRIAETTSSAFRTLMEEAAKERNPEKLEELVVAVGELSVLECSVAEITEGDQTLHNFQPTERVERLRELNECRMRSSQAPPVGSGSRGNDPLLRPMTAALP
jgi:hypothetical protein